MSRMRVLRGGGIPAPAVLVLVATAVAAQPDAGWLESATAAIAAAEYELSSVGDGAFTAPNRANGLRSTWRLGVVEIAPRLDREAWTFSYELAGVARAGDGRPAVAGALRLEHADGAGIAWTRDGLVEWYVNDERGVEQGFTLARRPDGDAGEPVILEGWIEGLLAYPAADGSSVLLRTARGEDVLRVRDLVVTDARGVALHACLGASPGRLEIRFDDDGAAYPITVDPLFASPAWTAEAEQDGAAFGAAVATAGDVNGDGYSDVIVGAPRFDAGRRDEGRAFAFHGSASGLATLSSWTAYGDQDGASFGISVATAGDVNGDGFSDVVVGAPGISNGQLGEGAARAYLGSAVGLRPTPAWIVEGGRPNAIFGVSVAAAGDVNGDSYADVIVGAKGWDDGELDEGAAFVYHGSPTGLSATASWTVQGDQPGAELGCSVAAAGDVNADAYADVIVGVRGHGAGAADEGAVHAYHGSAAGLDTSPAWSFAGGQAGGGLGSSVSSAGDVNGDGFSDVIVGANLHDGGLADEGRALAFHGSASGLGPAPAWTIESNQALARFGDVALAGDVNGDGYADVIVGAPGHDNGHDGEGRAFAYHGSATGLRTTPAWTAESNQANAAFGAVATAGDVDGDGYSDVIVGAPAYDRGQNDEGRAFLYHGSAAGLSAAAEWTAESDQTDAALGISVASAGDVNGDGFSDLVVGAAGYDDGEPGEGRAFAWHGSASGLGASPAWTADGNQSGASFGRSLASAGDVNGDGYSDVIVGAFGYGNGQAAEGRAFAYHGSPAGLDATPAWTAESDQAGAVFGYSVAGAGDVNGDGYSDVVVGAFGYSNGEASEGAAYAFHGSPAGLGAAPAWRIEGNQAGAWLGASVAGAGDVNGDGHSDVVVGAHRFAGAGRALVHHGSSSGLRTAASWTADGDQVGAAWGVSVAGAGDVNGDGFSDVIVGAYKRDGVGIDEGQASAYLGSATGLGAVRAWTVEGGRAGAELGFSVASAGDVNGDGYSDVVVGAFGFDNGQPGEGRALAFHGSASGLAAAPAWSVESNHGEAKLGCSVASAGDVNGDGFGDVVVGAEGFGSGQFREGRAFVHFGNAGDGLDRLPRQARGDGSAPVALLGTTTAADGFRIQATGRVPFGRAPVRLEWEARPLGTPFDGSTTMVSAWFDTGVPGAGGSAVELEEIVAPLPADVPYHWRARLRSRTTVPWQSPWMSVPGNAASEADLRAGQSDNCPTIVNPGQADADEDGAGDPCDPCPLDAGDDEDADGLCADVDNCPTFDNALQDDFDLDGVGDPCDDCPTVGDPGQEDADGDGAGDACDPCRLDADDDVDADGDCADVDNCDGTPNPVQEDADADLRGDACDPCPLDPDDDADGDSLCADVDLCDTAYDPGQEDADTDLRGDACDPCPLDPDDDADGDSLCANVDNCDSSANPGQEDFDGDGLGDACECAGVPALPDGGVGDTLRAAGSAFTWTVLADADRYPVFRGTVPRDGGLARRPQPYDHACLVTVSVATFSDPTPPASGGFYYLVGALGDCSSAPSALGWSSTGAPRPVPACP